MSKECFVIMPFDPKEGYEGEHFKKIYNTLFKPAIEEAGFIPKRTDDDNSSHEIKLEIIRGLLDADMVLCDLSSLNPNVMFELGIRQAFDKPVVLVEEVGTSRIFDIDSISTVKYHKERIYEQVLEDKTMIVKAINDTEDKMEKGQICNSIVSLLGRQAAVMKNVESNQNNTLKYILETLEKIEKQSSQLLDSVNLPVSAGTNASSALGYSIGSSGMSYGITGGTYNPTGTLGMTFSPAVSRNFTYPLEKSFFEQVQDLWKDLAHANLTDNDKIDLLNGKPLKDENKLQSAKEAGSTDNEGKITPKGRSKKSSK